MISAFEGRVGPHLRLSIPTPLQQQVREPDQIIAPFQWAGYCRHGILLLLSLYFALRKRRSRFRNCREMSRHRTMISDTIYSGGGSLAPRCLNHHDKPVIYVFKDRGTPSAEFSSVLVDLIHRSACLQHLLLRGLAMRKKNTMTPPARCPNTSKKSSGK